MRHLIAVLCLPVLACNMQADPSTASTAPAAAETSALRNCPMPSVTRGVFTLTDDAQANAVLAFSRDDQGQLTPVGSFFTGGAGSGAGEHTLKSQGALTLSTDHQFLYAVNAGSNEVSSFHVNGATLTLMSHVSSGGLLPVSVTEYEGLVYVLNAGGTGNIAGFVVDRNGRLSPLAGSMQPLSSSASAPAEISFDPWGSTLVVSEKATQALTQYTVDASGLASAPTVLPSAGQTPFGFSFTPRGVLVVSEAFGGAAGASATSTYAGPSLQVVSASVPDGQTGNCWIATTRNGKFAYAANTGSANLSSYGIGDDGSLTLLSASAATLPDGLPLDLALTSYDRFLYALDAAQHTLVGFAVAQDGSVTSLGALATGLPSSAVGLAAR